MAGAQVLHALLGFLALTAVEAAKKKDANAVPEPEPTAVAGMDPVLLVAIVGVVVVIAAIYFILGANRKPFLKEHHRERVKVPLIHREMLSHDTVLLRFGMKSSGQVLGLPVGGCIKFFAPNVTGVVAGQWNGREDSEKDHKEIERKYTPTTSDLHKGYFDLVIKIYSGGVVMPQFPDGGKMSTFMGKLKVGDQVEISGPWGMIEYTAPGTFVNAKKVLKKKHVGLLAGGTGITPMLQVLTAVFENPQDATTCSLVYANKTEDDILVRNMLDTLAAKHPDRLKIHYTLDNPPKDWKFSKGFITDAMLKAHLPPPGADTVVLMCGPPPMVQYACKANLDKLGYEKADQLAF
eukprot:CAMPEP_0172613204 /NCGR_PEP_ID=MMETSP1068-20121228/40529_1 /TAXON_ID=35684 /ORGANISM="Pseudopedinella elastica, Strain CCMP716" /LENGTH=349 /DNA_ID=CAMNT_0013417595 /DNA_START=11 /DNA_END=1060 /DNA_ORIENTATION=-